MLDLLLSRETVIGIAIVGGLLSIVAMVPSLKARLGEERTRWVNRAAHGFMLTSIAVFIVVGFRGVPA